MICAVVMCALLAGSNTKCEPNKHHAIKYSEIATQADCAAVADFIRVVGPMNGVSMRRWESFNKSKDQ